MSARGRLQRSFWRWALVLTACGDTERPKPRAPWMLPPRLSPRCLRRRRRPGLPWGMAPGSSLDPLSTADQSNLDVAALVYEGLYQLDSAFEAQPVLVQSSTVSADGLIWTVTIRGDVVFSNGEPLTAQHVADSLQRAKSSPGLRSPAGGGGLRPGGGRGGGHHHNRAQRGLTRAAGCARWCWTREGKSP